MNPGLAPWAKVFRRFAALEPNPWEVWGFMNELRLQDTSIPNVGPGLARPRPTQEPALKAVKGSALQRVNKNENKIYVCEPCTFVTKIRVIISPRHRFRSVPALKGRQNVASGNARQETGPSARPQP